MKKIDLNIVNVPNTLTILRIVLSPVFFYFLIQKEVQLALIVFMFVAVTDLADGWVARTAKQKTKFGEAIDPMADKFMVFLAIIALVISYDFPYWAIPLILVRDIVSLCGSVVEYLLHKTSWKASNLGKITTFMQVVTILAYIISFEFKSVILVVTIFFSILTAISYLIRGFKLLRSH